MAFRLQSSPKSPGRGEFFQSQNKHVWNSQNRNIMKHMLSKLISYHQSLTFRQSLLTNLASNFKQLRITCLRGSYLVMYRLPEGWTVKPTRGCGNGHNCQVFIANPSAEWSEKLKDQKQQGVPIQIIHAKTTKTTRVT